MKKLLLVLLCVTLVGCGKYAGRTAKEWEYYARFWEGKYRNLRDCIEFNARHNETAEDLAQSCL